MRRSTELCLFSFGIAVISIINVVIFFQPVQFLYLKNSIEGKEAHNISISLEMSGMMAAKKIEPLIYVEKWSWNVTPEIKSGDSSLLKLKREIQLKTELNNPIVREVLLESLTNSMGKIRAEGDLKWHSPQEQASPDNKWNWNFTANTPGKKLIKIVLPPFYGQKILEKKKHPIEMKYELEISPTNKSNLISRFIIVPIIVSRFGLHPYIEDFLIFIGWVIGILLTAPLLVEFVKTKYFKGKSSSNKNDANQIVSQCRGITKKGKQCKKKITDASGYCKMHNRTD